MSAERVREIRRSLAKTTREFEQRFGIPARTIEGWEQGRRLDVAHRVLLTVIARSPDLVEAALAQSD
jgi:putative transcriptional regulator